MAILHTHRDAIVYVDRARVFVSDDVVVYDAGEGSVLSEWNIPAANVAVLLLGTGSSITDAAMRRLAENRVLLGITGTGGVPLLMGSMDEYRPTERLHRWITVWMDERRRLVAAKSLARHRIKMLRGRTTHPRLIGSRAALIGVCQRFERAVEAAGSVPELMAQEGNFAKTIYALHAAAFNLQWTGRDSGRKTKKDRPNAFMDHGNYLIYGSAAVALWCFGISPSLAVTHGQSRAGGLVFDLADVLKDSFVLARAFDSVASGKDEVAFRAALIEDIRGANAIKLLMDAFDAATQEALA
jgi:CRISPR-associated protein Cas1